MISLEEKAILIPAVSQEVCSIARGASGIF